jgi:ABC-type lipoprotein release transport system permease subunit
MSKWKIAWRSIQQRALASSLTGVSMALGVMLVVAVLVIHGVVNRSFLNNSGLGYNVVVGPKGGRLDLVLNTVYYLSRPVENIPYTYYQQFTKGRFKQYVDKAIPVCLGDMYRDFRVIGTTPAFFNELDYGGHKYEFSQGENFADDDFFGAVIGSTVAREAGLRVGDEFQPTHGVGPEAHVHDAFIVRGVLKPTGTPNDRGLFINMEGFYLIPEHAKPLDDDSEADEMASHEHADGGHAHHDAEHEGQRAHEGEADHNHDHAEHDHEKAAADDHDHEANEHAEGTKHLDRHEDTDEDEHARPRARHSEEMPDEDADHEHAEHADHDHADHKDAEHDHDHADREHADHDHAEHDHKDSDHEHADHAHAHHHHDHQHSHEPLPVEQREVTAILVLTASVGGAPPELMAPELIKKINKDSVAQAVLPIREMTDLFSTFVNPLQLLLLGLTVMIVIVSGIGVLVSIYNSMSDRRHEIAVMRALGAGRRTVMFIVLLESILLSLAGGVAGWAVGHGLITALSPWIVQRTGVSVGALQFVGYELVIIPGLIVLASVVGYLPALTAYRTDVAKSLSATP